MTLVAARAHLPCRIFRDLPRGPRRKTPTPRCLSPQEVSQEEAVNHTERAFQSFGSLTHIQFQGFPTSSWFSNPIWARCINRRLSTCVPDPTQSRQSQASSQAKTLPQLLSLRAAKMRYKGFRAKSMAGYLRLLWTYSWWSA